MIREEKEMQRLIDNAPNREQKLVYQKQKSDKKMAAKY